MPSKITVFDTTMRDGELMPGIKMNGSQKLNLAKLLEEMRVDVIEVGYPAAFEKDFDEIVAVSKQVRNATICGLASSNLKELAITAEAIQLAANGRIHLYTPVNLRRPERDAQQTLEVIQASVCYARNACADIEWSAFDAVRSEPDFLSRAVEVAITSGATTISIPDSMGTAYPAELAGLISMLMNRVPNIEQAVISVHCHDDMGLAVQNSIAALDAGARQIECSLNGLGARKGNADLGGIVDAIATNPNYQTDVDQNLIPKASELVTQITRK